MSIDENGRKVYHLIGADGKPYDSYEKGTLGGHRELKIYGRLIARVLCATLPKACM